MSFARRRYARSPFENIIPLCILDSISRYSFYTDTGVLYAVRFFLTMWLVIYSVSIHHGSLLSGTHISVRHAHKTAKRYYLTKKKKYKIRFSKETFSVQSIGY